MDPCWVESNLRAKEVNFVRVQAIDSYKVLITFHSTEEMVRELVVNKETMLSIMDEIHPWKEEEACKVRRTWLLCRGVPLHGWSKTNTEKIGEVWGKVVSSDLPMHDLKAARVQIDTTIFSLINSWICLVLNGNVYDIFVMECMEKVEQLVCHGKGNSRNVPSDNILCDGDKGASCHGDCRIEDEASESINEEEMEDKFVADKPLMQDNIQETKFIGCGGSNNENNYSARVHRVSHEEQQQANNEIEHEESDGLNKVSRIQTHSPNDVNLEDYMFVGLSRSVNSWANDEDPTYPPSFEPLISEDYDNRVLVNDSNVVEVVQETPIHCPEVDGNMSSDVKYQNQNMVLAEGNNREDDELVEAQITWEVRNHLVFHLATLMVSLKS